MSTILGPDGRPLDLRAVLGGLEEPQTAQLGAIRREFDRHPARGLTPAKLAALMASAEQGNLAQQAELADDEREVLTRAILEHVAGRVPVIVTTTHFGTQVCAARCRCAIASATPAAAACAAAASCSVATCTVATAAWPAWPMPTRRWA